MFIPQPKPQPPDFGATGCTYFGRETISIIFASSSSGAYALALS
jgi:hypothetical protein